MEKQELIHRLVSGHQKFTNYLAELSDSEFMLSPNGKWSAGQQAEHILRSVSPVASIMRLPKWMVRLIFRKANRPSKTYDQLIEKYRLKLQKGGRASGRFIPGVVGADMKMLLGKKINAAVSGLCRSVEKYTEAELDRVVLPHPLLGRLTLREMLYFTILHVEHHQKLVAGNLLLKQ
jgi:hypothetical protein